MAAPIGVQVAPFSQTELLTAASLVEEIALWSLHASITNESFETPTVPAGSYTDYASGSTGITGWKVVASGGDVAVVSGSFAESGVAFPAEDGSQWLDLTGVTANSIEGVEQTVSTTAGTSYTLSFWVGNVDNLSVSFGTTSTVNLYLGDFGKGAFEARSTVIARH